MDCSAGLRCDFTGIVLESAHVPFEVAAKGRYHEQKPKRRIDWDISPDQVHSLDALENPASGEFFHNHFPEMQRSGFRSFG
jgi:hypothetical protein